MSSQKQKLEMFGDEWVSVDPIHQYDGREPNEYRFNRVYVSDIEVEDVGFPAGVEAKKPEDEVLLYKYREAPEVLITQDGPYVREGVPKSEGERQAYFALSVLDSEGYVGGFRRT